MLQKIDMYSSDTMITFAYAGNFYELAVRLWFEVHNKWPLSPKEAIPYIREHDQVFIKELTSFIGASNSEYKAIGENIIDMLKSQV